MIKIKDKSEIQNPFKNLIPESKLPNKIWQLLDLAIKDFTFVVQNPYYRINMDFYHTPNLRKNVCKVCFAGSVMAGTCKVPINEEMEPYDIDGNDQELFYALDNIRSGDLESVVRDYGPKRLTASQQKDIDSIKIYDWLGELIPYIYNENGNKVKIKEIADLPYEKRAEKFIESMKQIQKLFKKWKI